MIEPLVDARSGMSRRVGDRRPSVRAPRRVLGLLWLALPLLGVGLALADGTALPRSGAQLYRAACAACHGDDGRGQPRAVVGFDTELPDFTDCSFATREADSDWFAVVHEGGPARGFARMMPAFGGALSKAQIARALAHVRTFCRQRRSWPRGELNLPRPLVTSKAFPEDEAVLSSGVVLRGEHAVVNDLVFETRLGARGQLEVVLPIAFREQADGDGWAGGLGDIVVGGKWALLHSLRWGSILSAGLDLVFPSGDDDRGLGKGVWLFEPFLAYGQLLPFDGFVQLQAGLELSTRTAKASHELFWRAVVGMSFFQDRGFGRAWSPMVELLGARELEEDATTHWDIVPQLQVTLPTRQHVRVALGVRLPLDHFADRPTQLMCYLLWDWFDGSLLEGW